MKFLILISFLTLSLSAFAKTQLATFAGGCFWCMEQPFEELVGVKSVVSGFSGGDEVNPKYKDVARGKTGHREVVQITYDDQVVDYKRLLEIFWMNINPSDNKGQFVDRGHQYSPAIYYHNQSQKKLALESIAILESLKKLKVRTPVEKFKSFYAADDYHQDFYKKNLVTKTKYKYYRNASGRDDYLEKVWKNDEKLFKESKKYKKDISKLTKEQIYVTQEDGTERPFENKYWNNKKEGIYVDIASGEPLFSSTDKYKSGTGWPSFTKPINPHFIIERFDNKLLSTRVEVRSRYADSHLGHVFNDGPAPTNLRYCINSASLRFIPKERLKEAGYETLLALFN